MLLRKLYFRHSAISPHLYLCFVVVNLHPAAFVYFGILPVDSESPEAKLLIPYALGVVDALQIRNGATHCEIMMTADGPCLVVSAVVRVRRWGFHIILVLPLLDTQMTLSFFG